MSRKSLALVATLLVLALAAAAVWVARCRRPRPNLLLITLDTTRADRLGCYGHAAACTPALDALAAQGIRFTRAYCNAPLTLPSHASILTGLHPPEHGCRVNGENRIGAGIPTLATTLAARGYDTAAFVAAVVLDAQFGLDRGFDRYDGYSLEGGIDPRDELALIRYRRADAVADAALAWLRGRSRKPFFAWVHFYDPHRPYYLDEPMDAPDPSRAYDLEIAFMDRQIGRLVAHLRDTGALARTVVIAVGDHGEMLGEHDEDEHGLLLYDAAMRVPLIVRLPRAKAAGRVSDTPASTVDILPTALAWLRIEPETPVSGRSLASVAQGGALPEVPLYLETLFPHAEYGWAPLFGMQLGDWKVIRAPRDELYDLSHDPGEVSDLAESHPERLNELRRSLEDLESRMRLAESEAVAIDPAKRRVLESLGYMGGGAADASDLDPATLRNPKEAVWMRRVFMDALYEIREGSFGPAETRLRKLIAASPESLAFQFRLGKLLFGQNRFEEARVVFSGMAERFPDNYAPHYDLGKTLIRLQRYDAAITALARAESLDGTRVEVLNNLGLAYTHQGALQQAAAVFQRSIAIDARQVDPQSNLGHVLLQMGRPEEAAAAFRLALEVDPDAVGPRYNLGLALLQLLRDRDAAREFERVLRLKPDFVPAREKLKLANERSSLIGPAP